MRFAKRTAADPVAQCVVPVRCGRCGRRLYVRYWGKAGTAARYLCSGDFGAAGGRYCLGFGGATVDRRFGEEIVRVLSPLVSFRQACMNLA